MLTIRNSGQEIAETNYWSLPHAQRGFLYLSGNAGALRLLVPAAAGDYLAEMRTGTSVTIEPSTTPGCVDIVFEDGSDAPFSVSLDRRQCERAPGSAGQRRFLVYTQDGLQIDLQATIRE